MGLVTYYRFQEKRDEPPPEREQLRLSKFIEESKVPSKIVKGLFVAGPDIFHCPRCSTHSAPPEHGDRFRCDVCHLNMETYGDALYIWE